MSTYEKMTRHPETDKWEMATWEDDYFGSHQYGIKFPSEPGKFWPDTGDIETADYQGLFKTDPTNPSHYKTNSKESIEIIKDFLSEEAFKGFLKGNILKYVYRYENKNGKEDLEKATWYLNYLKNL